MKRAIALSLLFGLSLAGLARAGAPAGRSAPDFTAADSKGRPHTLAEYKGKFVVLEWHNQGCPYVKKHYNSGNMQRLQREWTARGVIWLTVESSAPGKQGYVIGPEADAYVLQQKAAPTAVLLDPTGALGFLYDARTSPHMFVIDPKGMVVYNGAIDNKPSTDASDVADATNYVSAALKEAMAGKAVTTPSTRPYGCSVKYASGGSL
jgi:hypothetical protein